MSGSAGRRKCCLFAVEMSVCTGDFGTSARHLPRKRYSHRPAIPFIQQTYPARAGTAARPYAEILPRSDIASYPIQTNLSTRRAVECRAGGPLAGLSTDQTLQVSTHSAAIRSGTIHDGQFHHGMSIPKDLPSGMVDPLSQRTVPTSPAEPAGYRILRNIRRPRHIRDASTAQAHIPRSPTPGLCKTINHPHIETLGRTRRSAPTQGFFLDPTLPVIQYRQTSQRAAWWDVERVGR